MTLKYLLDANILSEPLRTNPNPGVLASLREHGAASATAAPVWHELLLGVRILPRSSRRETLESYLAAVADSALPVLAYDEPAASWHASERARLRALGAIPPFVDGQIAAIAAVNGLTLVTRSTADFDRFERLVVEDWFSA